MPESSPWDDIAVPGANFNVRQVAVGTAVPCFWGRDAGGACLFIVELQGDHAAQYRKNSVTVNGNWRMTFTFEDGDAVLVDYQDYY